ncbi:MAG TPA: hypothetical protein VF287_05140, partial [Usitatibacter sp.]
MRDADVEFHREWLGLAQPIEGLVFSVPALADAQIAPKVRPTLGAELQAHLQDTDRGLALRNVRVFFETFLGYGRAGMLVARAELPNEISFYAPEGRQEIRPSFAIARGPIENLAADPFAHFESPAAEQLPSAPGSSKAQSPYFALVWDLADDTSTPEVGVALDLDRAETETG